MSYTPPTIAQRGGLKVYLVSIDIDYDQFKELRLAFGEQKGAYTSIATVLSKGRRKKLSPRTIAHWYKIDDTEESARAHKKIRTDPDVNPE